MLRKSLVRHERDDGRIPAGGDLVPLKALSDKQALELSSCFAQSVNCLCQEERILVTREPSSVDADNVLVLKPQLLTQVSTRRPVRPALRRMKQIRIGPQGQ